jgi:nucleoside-diphosphate-sugar epimerase
MSERFLVTGALGCVGAWVVRQLVDEGTPVAVFDAGADDRRLRLVLAARDVASVPRVRGDIADLEALERALDEHAITHVIHLAALQVPFCRADPPLGALVNVVGTVNVLEAARRRAGRMAPVVYASSIAALDAADDTGAGDGAPGTLYGVYKRANEGTAALYWRDWEVASVGLRPHTVYGPGRDQGLTSAPTAAMLAAAAGVPFHIPFGGRLQMHYAPDAAAAFVAASRSGATGATVHNLPGDAVGMDDVVAAIDAAAPAAAGLIDHTSDPLPFPAEADASSFAAAVGAVPATPLRAGVADAVERFRGLLAAGLVEPPEAAVARARHG